MSNVITASPMAAIRRNAARDPSVLFMSVARAPRNPRVARSKPVPVTPNEFPKRVTLADVVTESMVEATPAPGVTMGGLKLQVIPVRTGQEKVTGSANPPVGVTDSVNKADWPAVTVAFGGATPSVKSASATMMVTASECCLQNSVSLIGRRKGMRSRCRP